MTFEHDYDLQSLKLIQPRGQQFRLHVTPRFSWRYEHDEYEAYTARLLAKFCERASVFVDVGAHYGFFSLLAASRHPHLRVIAAEPVRENFEILTRNVQFNGFENIQLLNLAISDSEGSRPFHISSASDNCSFYVHPATPTLRSDQVRVATMDGLLASAQPGPVVLKIDTDGNEFAVLDGMKQTLERFPDVALFIEFNPQMIEVAGRKPSDLLQRLDDLGFSVFRLDDKKRRHFRISPGADWSAFCAPNGYVNLVCLPKERALNAVFVSHLAGLGGAERCLLELVDEWMTDHWTLATVLSPEDGPLTESLREIGAAVVIAPFDWWCHPGQVPADANSRMARSIRAIINHLPLFQNINPDLIWTQSIVVPWGALLAAFLRKPHIWSVCEYGEQDHQFRFYLPFAEVVRAVKFSSNFIFAVSPSLLRTLFAHIDPQRADFLFPHVRMIDRKQLKAADATWTKTGVTRIAAFGTLQNGKGQEDLVRAAGKLVARGRRVELLLAGYGAEPYFEQLQLLAKELGISEHVTFTGFINDPHPTMATADIVVSCARLEAFGLSLVEAMLLERAIVYAGAGGPLDYMADGKTGLSYRPRDADKLAEQLEKLIENPTLRKRLGRQARTQAEKLFTRAGYGEKAFERAIELREQPAYFLSTFGDGARVIFEAVESLVSLLNAGTDESNPVLQDIRAELATARSRIAELENVVEVWSNQAKGLEHGVQVWSKQARDLEADRAAINAQLAELHAVFAEKSKQFHRELDARENRIGALHGQVQQLLHEIETAAARHTADTSISNSNIQDAKHRLQIATDEIARFYQSRSWRWTAPLRAIRRYLTTSLTALAAWAIDHARRLYHIMPLSPATRRRITSIIFAVAQALPRRLLTYRSRVALQRKGAPPLHADAYRIDGDISLPINNMPLQIVPPARLIAFYLPQFHPISENDKFWGKDFTEWTNVKRATPQFAGHYQPRLPGELGYYDLRLVNVQRRQVELAKLYGIGGFCFYFYWFNGLRLLEAPLEQYLANTELDLPFCLCWANENWTRAWDGLSKEVLIEQNHSPQDDLAFIQHLARYLADPRYIRVKDRPLVVVYRPSLLPAPRETAERWRLWCREQGLGEIYLAYVQSFDAVDPAEYGFDAAIEFPPNNLHCPFYSGELNLYNPSFSGQVYDWEFFVRRSEQYEKPSYVLFRGVNPSWDNEGRRLGRGTVMIGSSPEGYRHWLENALRDTVSRFDDSSERLIFINAWNEWAEGAYLEPDRRYGYAYLQATRDAIEKVGQEPSGATAYSRSGIFVVGHDAHPHGAQFLALNIFRELRQVMGLDAECMLLRGGSLTPMYAQIGPIHELHDCSPETPESIEIVRRLRARGFHTALCNTAVSGHFAPILKNAGFKVISLVHELPQLLETYEGYGLRDRARSIAAAADTIVFPGKFVADGFRKFAPFDQAKATILTQGLYKRNRFKTATEIAHARAKLRERLGLASDTRIILSVAFADRRKGIDLFVDIGERLLADMPNTVFVWVGHSDAEIKEEITSRIARSAYSKHFIFPGFIADTDPLFAGADLYALTSREDAFPSVILESLEVGVPVVAFEGTGAFEQAFRTYGVGRLVAPFDTDAFAQELKSLLKDETQRIAMGRAGSELVKREFSFRKYVYDLMAIAQIPVKRVSVLVPNYNYRRYLEARLRSISNQTIPPYEVIVIDDASTDGSREWLDENLEQICPGAEFFYNEINSGSTFSQWLSGVRRARGDYVWIAEADDVAEPDFLAEVLAKFDEPDVVLSFCQSKQMDSDGQILCDHYLDYTKDISPTKWTEPYVNSGVDEIVSALSIKNTIPNVSAVVFKRDTLLTVLEAKLAELAQFRVAGDWVTYIEVLRRGNIAFSPRSLNLHRRHLSGITMSSFNLSQLKEIMSVQQKVREEFKSPDAINDLAASYSEKLFEQFGLANSGSPCIHRHPELSKLLTAPLNCSSDN